MLEVTLLEVISRIGYWGSIRIMKNDAVIHVDDFPLPSQAISIGSSSSGSYTNPLPKCKVRRQGETTMPSEKQIQTTPGLTAVASERFVKYVTAAGRPYMTSIA